MTTLTSAVTFSRFAARPRTSLRTSEGWAKKDGEEFREGRGKLMSCLHGIMHVAPSQSVNVRRPARRGSCRCGREAARTSTRTITQTPHDTADYAPDPALLPPPSPAMGRGERNGQAPVESQHAPTSLFALQPLEHERRLTGSRTDSPGARAGRSGRGCRPQQACPLPGMSSWSTSTSASRARSSGTTRTMSIGTMKSST